MKKILLLVTMLAGLAVSARGQFTVIIPAGAPPVGTKQFKFQSSSGSWKTLGNAAQLVDNNNNPVGTISLQGHNGSGNYHHWVYFNFTITGNNFGGQLLPNTTYKMVASGPLLEKTNGEQWPTASGTFHTFTTGADDVQPKGISISPAKNSTNVSGDGPFVITFDEKIQKGTGNIVLHAMDFTGRDRIVNISSSQVLVSNNTTTIPRSNVIVSLTDYLVSDGTAAYYLEIEEGAFVDLSGNESVAYGESWLTNFSVENTYVYDTSPPLVVTQAPEHQAVQVAASTYRITFNEEVKRVGNFYLRDASDNSIYATFGNGNTFYKDDKHSIEMTLIGGTAPFAKQFYLEIPEGAITDLAGNAFAGFGANEWRFRIVDNVKPVITAFTPLDEAQVPTSFSTLTMTFDEDIEVGNGSISLYKFTGTSQIHQSFPVGGNNVTVDGNVLTVSGLTGLLPNQAYYVLAPYGFVTDLYGNSSTGVADRYIWNFATEAAANEAPTDIALSFSTINENQPVGTAVGSFSTSDVNATDTHSYSLVAGSGGVDNSSFTIEGNILKSASSFDFESQASYNIRVRSFDGIAGFERTFVIQISNVAENSPPSNITLVGTSVNENSPLGTVVGTLSSTDADGGDSHTYALIAGEGDTNNGSFYIAGNSLRTNAVFDFETKTSYSVRIRTSDGTAAFAKVFTITVNDVVDTDITGPLTSSLTPGDGGTGIFVDASLVLTFNEPIKAQAAGGTVSVKRLSDNAVMLAGQPKTNTTDFTVAGSTLSIHLSGASLAYETGYYVTIDEYSIEDLAGNYYLGFADNTTWNFTTATAIQSDATAPTVVGFDPATGSSNNSYDHGYLSLTFSEEIRHKSQFSTTFILQYNNFGVWSGETKYFQTGTEDVTFSGNTITLNNVPDLDPNRQYRVVAHWSGSGAIEDLNNNDFVEWGYTDLWTFTVASGAAVAAQYPAHSSTNIPTYANVEITFDQSISVDPDDSQFAMIFKSGNAQPYYSFSGSSGEGTNWWIVGNTLVLNPNYDFDTNTSYEVRLRSLQTSDGIDIHDIANEDWQFTTGTVVNNAATNITLTKGGVAVTKLSEQLPVGAFIGTLAAVDPNAGDTHTYELYNTAGFNNDKFSIEGNQLYIAETFDFASIPQAKLRIITYDQYEKSYIKEFYFNTNALPTDITLSNASINEGAAAGTNIGYFSTIDANSFANSYTYELVEGFGGEDIGSFTIAAGGLLKSAAVFDYETKNSYSIRVKVSDGMDTFEKKMTITVNYVDIEAPLMLSFSPAHLATGVASDENLTITFNEPIVAGSGHIWVRKIGSGETVISGAVTSNPSIFTVEENTLTIHLANYNGNAPTSSTTYYVTAASGSVKDAAYNSFAGINNSTTWNFTTADIVAPLLNTKSPLDNATGVAVGADLVLTFNEPVAMGFGEIGLYNGGGSLIESFSLLADGSRLSVSGNALAINPTGNLLASESYYLLVAADAVTDVAGNYFAGITNSDTWNFATATAGQAPTNIMLSASSFSESIEAGETIATLSATDPDANTSSFQLVDTESLGTSVDDFYIAGSRLYAGEGVFDANTKSTYDIRIRATDNDNNKYTKDFQLTVTKGQTITFAAMPEKTFGDAPFNLDATASSTLTVSYASSDLSVATVDGTQVTIMGAGSTLITATQAGNGAYRAADPEAQELIVNKASQLITVSPIADKAIDAVPFAVSATVDSELPLTYSIVSGPATNVASNVTLDGTVGEVTVKVSQAGNANYLPAESVEVTFLVTDPSKTNQSITFSQIGDQTYGSTITLEATASSALAIDYQLVSGPASLNGSELTFTGLGSVTVRATQAGDDDYNPAAQVSRSFEVGKAALTATAENKQMTYGDALPDLTYTVTGFVNSETADVIAGNIEATTEASASSDAGEYAITVSGGTAENYEFSYVDGTLTIGKADQLIAFETLEAKTFGDASFDLVASSDAALPVTFTSSNEAVATISDATVTIVGAGTATITAVQAGSINYNEAETTQELTVSKAGQTITFEAIGNQVLSTGSITLAATASSGLAIGYEVSGPATLAGTTLTFTGAGDITVTASQAGNVNYMAATALPRTFTVTDDTPVDPVKQDQVITFDALADKTFGDAAFDLIATANSGLPVSYIITGSATISENTVTITGAGSVTITASQAGNDSFNAAADVSQSFTVNKATATITLSDLEQEVDGTPKTPTVVTDPAGLEVVFTFDGETIVPVVAGSYTVVATINDANYNGSAEAEFELTEVVETGIGDELSQILVYPNPFVETIKIEGKNLGSIRLHNLNGQLMFERAVTGKTELTIPDLMPGVYLLYLVDGEGRSNIRRMVKK
ncbi:MAG: Ig-like domain-containing protein [Imperialibacter sp.]|uniref:Ig-like domain-containing protein n=1 Tax=Imperialibacter sp. TaxID=2038411 RepID=UPI0032EB13EE